MTTGMWDAYHPAVQPTVVDKLLREAQIYSVSPLTVMDTGDPVPASNGLPGWAHAVGDKVVVARMDNDMLIVASRASRPTQGTVTSFSTTTVTVAASGITYVLNRILTYSPVNGDVVRIIWDEGGGTALGKIPTETLPPSSGTVDAPSATGRYVKLDLDPVGAASYRSGSRRTDRAGEVIQGHYLYSSNTADSSGVLVYGDVWGSVAGMVCSSFEVTMKRLDGSGVFSGVPVHLIPHIHQSLPSGAPTFVSAEYAGLSLAVNGSGVATLSPTQAAAWGALFASAAAYGVGVVYAGTAHYASFYGPDLAGAGSSGHITATFTG